MASYHTGKHRWFALSAGALLLLSGCHRSGGGRVHHEPTVIYQGDGWSVRIPSNARVRVEPDVLAVDAADGRSWFDIRWHSTELPPPTLAWSWGTQACTPLTWDQPHVASEGLWTGGGLCVVNDVRHWAFVAIEERGDRLLQIAYIAEHRRHPYEDAWVDFTRTALSLQRGETPLPAPDPDTVREWVREAMAEPPGHMPLPGGGLLSGRVSDRLGQVWEARRQSEAPERFAPEPPAP